MSAWIGVGLVIAAVGASLLFVRGLQRRYGLQPEWTRKLVHLGGGSIAMSFPWLFRDVWPVVVVCAVSAAALFVVGRSRRLDEFHRLLGAVDRRSHGEFYFPLAVMVVFVLAQGDTLLYEVPVMVLAFADAAAGIVGVHFGRTRFAVGAEHKTVEGSAACFAVAALCTYPPLALGTGLDTAACVTVALLVGVGAAVFEASATLGVDNLIVPLLVFAMLRSALDADFILLAVELALVLAALILLMRGGSNAYARRMGAYFREMLPLPAHAALALLLYAAIAIFARRVHGLSTPLFSLHGLVGVTSLFGLMVILRLMDEIKDEDIDRELFPDRPLASGRVRRADIRWSLIAACILFLAINLWAGRVFLASVVVLGYAALMLRRFFAPNLLRRSLPLTLLTHNPIVALMTLYGFAVFAAEHGLAPGEIRWRAVAPFVVMVWSPFLAWELARKIRSPQEETEYVTYSRILGPSRAVLVTWAVQAVAVGVAVYLWASLRPHGWFVPVIAAGFLANVWAGARFMQNPSPRTSRLKPFATAFAVSVLVAQVVGFAAAG